MPKKEGTIMIRTENNTLLPSRTVTGWKICIDYWKLNKATRKDHFPLSFLDQMLDRLAGHENYCFLDGYSGYNQIAIAPESEEDNIHMPLWYIRIQADALWAVQFTRHIPALYDGHIIIYG